jgi:hypothetical protein
MPVKRFSLTGCFTGRKQYSIVISFYKEKTGSRVLIGTGFSAGTFSPFQTREA